MTPNRSLNNAIRLALFGFCLAVICQPITVRAQDGEDIPALKQKAGELIRKQQYTEVLPLLEKIAAAEPEDAQTMFYLGFSLVATANVTKEAATRKALRVRARNAFIKAKQLGVREPMVDALIQSLPPDGADGRAVSQNAEANQLMTQAEGLFSQGKLDEALVSYQKALKLDPQLYEAALYSGDVYTQRGNFEQAEIWYQKAIAINPNRETAYRYSATPLMKQGKHAEARDRYVEAFVSEPYSRFSAAGLTQWGQATNTKLGHPAIEIPTTVSVESNGDAKINLDPKGFKGKEDGSFAWVTYGAERIAWRKEKFAKTFPHEKAYRHSLAEEAAAIRTVISIASANKDLKELSPALMKLKKLNDQGLLEAYILMARPDEGIAEDYVAYLKSNRDKLRRYVVEYVLTGGGN